MPELTDAELRERLNAALGVRRFVDEVALRAPFSSVDELLEVARGAATPLRPGELDEALAHHPRIGERPAGGGTSARLSAGEQGGLGASDEGVDTAIAEGNARYERRFGRVFLIRAAGRTRAEVLSELQRRLGNPPDVEAREAEEQLRQIMELRLTALFADGGAIR